mmetsp:Transcript_22107/g.37780  ORF Transcript_22107/g.37780 Transcript_22107/m.37780 type:complete len:257 (-) Transcript_22107:445-1215(-)
MALSGGHIRALQTSRPAAPRASQVVQVRGCSSICSLRTQPTRSGLRSHLQLAHRQRASLVTAQFGSGAGPLFEISDGFETPIQLAYLLTLLGFLAGGAFLVVRQVLVRRELDEAAKALGERIRTGEASCEDYFELGVVLTRKKLYTQATKNLERAKKLWDGEETELAQVHNALGFCYFMMDRSDLAIPEYKMALAQQPGYVTAWNNMGDAHESNKAWGEALAAYQEALSYAPSNEVALQRSAYCKNKIDSRATSNL